MFDNIPPASVLIAQVIVLFFGVGLHEYAHCKFADLAGDPTPRYYGRVTLNLFKHFDPLGAAFMFFTLLKGFGIGWGKPAPMDPAKMHNPRWDMFAAVAAGPLCNLLQAVIYAFFLRLSITLGYFQDIRGGIFGFVLLFGVVINLGLFLFNLIPFGPLDGHWLVGLLLPEKARYHWYQFNRGIGSILLLGAVLLMQTQRLDILTGPIMQGFQLLSGQNGSIFAE